MTTCKILIIDDDTDEVEILADAFKSSGVDKVHYVHTAMQAFMYLEAVRNEELPKLIITDMYLPGINGTEFLADLKSMPFYKHLTVIVLASSKNKAEIERYRQMGFDDYLVKPSTYTEYLKVAADIKSRVNL